MINYRKNPLAVTMIAALGVSAPASADTITSTWTGWFTMLQASGGIVANSDFTTCSANGSTGTNSMFNVRYLPSHGSQRHAEL
jgi:hypothetical protein